MEEKKVYSDGVIEDDILNKLGNQEAFKELYNRPGAVFHNFTPCRENLLNWYPFRENAKVLEIGAGMGALTGLLCQKAKSVTAVEESNKRAEIIRKRCRQYDNLTIISDDIYNLSLDIKYDYILLIGVLEYVGINKKDENPYIKLLFQISNLLQKDGKLLLAIENKFGLKYWCGAAEDHTSIPFDSINNYERNNITGRYGKSGVRTFSHAELKEMLDKANLPFQRYYYPLPDYKFPSAVFTNAHLPDVSDIRSIKFTYPMESELVANEKTIYKDIFNNNVFPFFANSFLIEASKTDLDSVYVEYVSCKRDYARQYHINTVIQNDRKVYKCALNTDSEGHLNECMNIAKTLQQRDVEMVMPSMVSSDKMQVPYFYAKPAITKFNEKLMNGEIDELIKMLEILKANLRKSSTVHKIEPCAIEGDCDFGDILDSGYIDMTFINSYLENDKLVFFDQEWCLSNIPLEFILYRTIKYANENASSEKKIKKKLYDYFNITDEKLNIFDQYEMQLLASMMDETNCSVFDSMMYDEGITIYPESRKTVQRMSNEIEEKNVFINIKQNELETTINNYNNEIQKQNDEIQKQNDEIQKQNDEIQKKSSQLQEQGNRLEQQQIKIQNQEGHIEQLLQKERDYVNLLNTKGVRVLKVWWGFKDWLFPQGSKRRLVAKLGKKFIKHPIYMIKKCTPSRIRRTLHYMKTENAAMIENRLDAATIDAGGDIERIKLNLFPINENMFSVTDVEKLQLPYYEKPVVSIVVPVYNQFHYTYNCVQSIIKYTEGIPYEVILADDCSTDLTKDIKEIVDNIVVARTPENMRFLRNCNHATKMAKGEYIYFLNNDTQVQEHWLDSLLKLMEKDETIGMSGSMLLYPDGALQEAGGILWKDGSAWNYGHQRGPLEPEFNYVKEADYISGAAIMIRKTLWEEIGGFDERFAPAYYEDTDLAFEVRKHGYKVVYQPLSKVVHFEGVSNGTDTSSGQKEYQIVNQKKFYDKWKDVLKAEHFPNGEQVFLAKDRSRNKKQILVVDHYVPNHDKDAGGKCTYMYLQMFVKMGMKVTFIGDNFYPQQPYTEQLNQFGIEVLYGNYYYNNWQQWLKDNGHYFDYIYLQRPHISIKYIDIVKEYSNAKILYFAHDLHHIREMREYELTGDEEKLKSSEKWKKIEYELFEKTDVGHVVGNYEQQIMQKAFPDKPIRNIPLYIYDSLPDGINKDFSTRNDIMYVGGFGHPPNIDAVLWFGKEVFPKILEKYPNMKWYVAGSKVTPEIQALDGENIKILGFVSDEELEALYRKCRMAIVPLRVGAGVKGKVVESAYYQIPLITTTIGAEGLDAEVGNMVVEDDADKMAEILCDLYEDYDKLLKMSDAGAHFITKYFTEDEAKRILLEDIVL